MHTAYIALGSNLGSSAGGPAETLAAAAERLGSLGHVGARSSLYLTEPVGLKEQPHFVNAVVALETGLSPRSLLQRLLALERDFGRDRTQVVAMGPRTLDLDILMIGDFVLHEAGLDVPHPRIADRAFVLIPLLEIAPGLVEPRSRQTVAALLAAIQACKPSLSEQVVRITNQSWDTAR